MPLDLACIGARAFAVQTLDGALHQRREILAAPGQRQASAKKATESVAVTVSANACVYSRGVCA